jgi:hypothetical protein
MSVDGQIMSIEETTGSVGPISLVNKIAFTAIFAHVFAIGFLLNADNGQTIMRASGGWFLGGLVCAMIAPTASRFAVSQDDLLIRATAVTISALAAFLTIAAFGVATLRWIAVV